MYLLREEETKRDKIIHKYVLLFSRGKRKKLVHNSLAESIFKKVIRFHSIIPSVPKNSVDLNLMDLVPTEGFPFNLTAAHT